jgi:predicted molibdopterin-dependent oxidoreductase YjgC
VNPLRGQSNVQGACDMGALPNVFPGYQSVTDPNVREKFEIAWGLKSREGGRRKEESTDLLPSSSFLSEKPGLTVVELMHAAEAKRVRAMYIMGENPMLSDPNLEHVEHALRTLDFLCVQDIFLTETAQLAHVVLPAASWLEKDGTKTNTERRVQLIHPVITAPGEAKADWWIAAEIGRRLEEKLHASRFTQHAVKWDFSDTNEIATEVAAVTPSYRGIVHRRLKGAGLCWPCPAEDHAGTPILHTQTFTRGPGKFHPVTAKLPAEQPDAEYPLILSTGRVLYHYHTGTMTRRSEGLSWREPRGWAEVNPLDAAAVGVRDATAVVIRSRRGQVRTQARLSERVPPGVVFLSFHWKESPANVLTQDFALDPLAKIPEFKVCAVRIENPRGKS